MWKYFTLKTLFFDYNQFNHVSLTGSKMSKFADVVNLHIKADLRCLKVFLRGQKARISEIRVEGMDGDIFSFRCLRFWEGLPKQLILVYL